MTVREFILRLEELACQTDDNADVLVYTTETHEQEGQSAREWSYGTLCAVEVDPDGHIRLFA